MYKIHLCCGDIYLDNYINVDIQGQLTTESTLEQIEANRTDLEHYFKYPFIHDAEARRKTRRPVIVDMKKNILDKWDFLEYNSVSEIVLVSTWEHFTIQELTHIKDEINRVVCVGGKLIVNFPDIQKTVNEMIDNDPFECSVLVYCNWKNQYSVHKTLWTPKSLQLFLGENWKVEETNIIKNDFPAFSVTATKIK